MVDAGLWRCGCVDESIFHSSGTFFSAGELFGMGMFFLQWEVEIWFPAMLITNSRRILE